METELRGLGSPYAPGVEAASGREQPIQAAGSGLELRQAHPIGSAFNNNLKAAVRRSPAA